MHTSPRGQVFPVYIGLIVLSLAFMAVIWDIGTIVSWEIRAQRSADTAAATEISVQAQEINRMEMLIWAGSIEEIRIRQLLYGIQTAAASNGPCAILGMCASDFLTLRAHLNQSIWRYTDLVKVIESATQTESFVNVQDDAWNLLDKMTQSGTCGTARGLDCAFGYAYRPAEGGIFTVDNSSPMSILSMGPLFGIVGGPLFNILEFVSCIGQVGSCSVLQGTILGRDNLAPNLLGPARAEVTVCHQLAFPFPLPYFSSMRIIAHSAFRLSTTNYEFSAPGDPMKPGGGAYLSTEDYTGTTAAGYYDWYDPTWSLNFNWGVDPITGISTGAAAVAPSQVTAWITWFGAIQVVPLKPLSSSSIANKCK